uniref:Uncharacterized protein n=1 Tax=Caenorhabditis japonica TaxID=281687 RepID=A0A8R1E9M9_CAEJA
MLSKLILLSSVFFQLAFASGHLRLEITASNDCTVRLLAGNVAKNIALKLGQEHTVVFHPLRDE